MVRNRNTIVYFIEKVISVYKSVKKIVRNNLRLIYIEIKLIFR